MADPAIEWDAGPTSVTFTLAPAFLASPSAQLLRPWLDEWQSDSVEREATGDALQLTLPFSLWQEAGRPPEAEADEESLDLFRSRHSAIARLLGLTSQQVRVETIGHVGSPDLSFLFVVDDTRIGEVADPTPFVKDGIGQIRPLVPVAYAMYERLCRWNAGGATTRAQQLVFVSELRAHLERAAAVLGAAAVPFSFELDAHLQSFHAERAASVALGWKPRKNGALFDLQVEQLGSDGARTPLDLDKLDPENPLIDVSATEHILLDPEVDAVARVARKHRNKLRKHVERHFEDPASLLPEGLQLDKVDLSAYSPRVLGFEPIVRAERFCDIQSSGIAWYDNEGTIPDAFLRLLIAQPAGGSIEVLEFSSPEAVEQAAEQLSQALRQQVRDPIEVAGRKVMPSKPLLERLHTELAAHRARTGEEAEPAPQPERGRRKAAVIAEDVAPAGQASEVVSDLEVPWAVLEPLLAPDCRLKDHQRAGIAWMWAQYKRRQNGVLLADDMGLGKTLQIAAFLALQRAVEPTTVRAPTMIVCPVILLDNWHLELKKFFAPHVFRSLVKLYGDELRRRKKHGGLDVDGLRDVDYVLTNYETLQAHQQSLLLVDWNAVVLDEAQAIKNPDTYRARAARGLKRRFGICSTGTPVENRLSDLWSLYDFLSPGDPFSTIKEFEQEYEADLEEGINKVRSRLRYPGAQSSLLRRTKDEVLALPEKTIQLHAVEMTPWQVQLERQVTKIGEEKGNILKILQDLQKLYQHPRLLVPESEFANGFSLDQALEESPKLALCVKILEDIRAAGEKALVFTLWTAMQALLVDVFKAVFGLRRIRVINGDPAQRRKAHDYIAEFTASDGFDLLVLSPLAAGTGLTITAANHVIHYGRWWNPAKEDQATDRAYRIGQTKPVRVHYPVLHHPGRPEVGFDVKLHKLVEDKRSMARDFLAPQPQDVITMADISQLQETDA